MQRLRDLGASEIRFRYDVGLEAGLVRCLVLVNGEELYEAIGQGERGATQLAIFTIEQVASRRAVQKELLKQQKERECYQNSSSITSISEKASGRKKSRLISPRVQMKKRSKRSSRQ